MEISNYIKNQLIFFNVDPNNISQQRISLFKQIHEIVFHGNGGYDWETVYNMPIWLRKYTFNEILKYNESQTPQNPNTKTLVDSDGKINPTQFLHKKSSYK